MNQIRQNRIRVMIEPQNAEVVRSLLEVHMLFQEFTFESLLSGMPDQLLKITGEQLILKRDDMLISLIDSLSADNLERAIVVPRGRDHWKMRQFFDVNKYDISFEIGSV